MADHDRVTEVPEPVLIDEWQLVPEAWERVRTAVDNDPHGGRFLLAGSAEVALGLRMHSGAGRIVSMTMRPLSFYEREICAPTVSLAKLLRGKEPDNKGAFIRQISAIYRRNSQVWVSRNSGVA